MLKLSSAEVSQIIKTAAENLRGLSKENSGLRNKLEDLQAKVASYEKKERAEKLASKMEDKGLDSELSYEEKVARLIEKDNLDVVEEAVDMAARQTKLATINESAKVSVEGGVGNLAEDQFAANLASIN